MTKPLRNPGLAHQFGAINNILNSSSHVPCSNQLDRCAQRAKASLGRADKAEEDRRQSRSSKDNKPYEQSRSSQHISCSDQRNSYQQNRRRSHSPLRSSTVPLHRHLGRPQPSAEDRRRDQRGSHSPQRGQQRDQSRMQIYTRRRAERPKEPKTISNTANQDSHDVQASSGKRKRTTVDDGDDDAQRALARKKQQTSHPNIGSLKSPLLRKCTDQEIVAPTSGVTTESLIPKGTSPSEPKTATQLLTPSSSHSVPERESHSEQILKAEVISKPTPTEKLRNNQGAPLLMDVQPARSKKRQRGESIEDGEEPTRSRKLKAVELPRAPRPSPVQSPSGLEQTGTALTAQVCDVRPGSSFAPVAPNHECDLKFLDYLHDSIPILYSTMINHSSGGVLLNSPSGTLVVDALATIGPSIDLNAKRGWPATIDLPDRAPSRSRPVKVLDDVDLYLHQTENELCVATERGLLTLTNYLKLIGVSGTQPVRIQGCVPSWARASFCKPEKRRIVWLERKHAGKMELVSADTALGTHQVALVTLQTGVEIDQERTHSGDTNAQVVVEANRSQVGDKQEKAESREVEILSAKPGQLPLRAGSIVLVYAVDDEGEWAYGRLSGTDKMGRLPMAFTCPIDWSLDKYAGTRNDLNEPLSVLKDHSERDWKGVYHWLRQGGHAFGPTWKETLELGAAKARDEKARNLAAGKLRIRTESHTTDATEPQAERSRVLKLSTDKPSHGPAPTSQVATAPPTATATGTMTDSQLKEALLDVSRSSACRFAKSTQVDGDQAWNSACEAKTDAETSKVDIETAIVSEDYLVESVQEATSVPDAGPQENLREGLADRDPNPDDRNGEQVADTFTGLEEAEAAEASAEQEVEVQMPQEQEAMRIAETVEAPAYQDPFLEPRLNIFARNDDIEYDWGDSDEEL